MHQCECEWLIVMCHVNWIIWYNACDLCISGRRVRYTMSNCKEKRESGEWINGFKASIVAFKFSSLVHMLHVSYVKDFNITLAQNIHEQQLFLTLAVKTFLLIIFFFCQSIWNGWEAYFRRHTVSWSWALWISCFLQSRRDINKSRCL